MYFTVQMYFCKLLYTYFRDIFAYYAEFSIKVTLVFCFALLKTAVKPKCHKQRPSGYTAFLPMLGEM